MLSISNNGIININRGDSFSLNVCINLGTCVEQIKYVLQPGDKVYFGLMEPNQPFECAISRRLFTNADLDENDNVQMNFSGEQTEFLLPGIYYYSVKLVRLGENNEEIVDTIIPKTKFIIID